MASKRPVLMPRYCMQRSRFTKQDGWRLWDLSLSLNGNIAVTGYNKKTHRTYIDVYTIKVRHSDSRDEPKIIYSKEFGVFLLDGLRCWGRFVSFYPDSDTTILSGLGDKLEVIDLIQNRVIKSRQIKLVNHGWINCLCVREKDIVIGFLDTKKITVYDVIDLNEIKSILLHGIQGDYFPYDMTATADRIFVGVGDGTGENNYKLLVFEEKNGRYLSELTKPTDTEQWHVQGIALNITLNVIAVAWSQTYKGSRKGKDVIVFYFLLSKNNCSFLIVEVEFGVFRIRISDSGDRMITGNRLETGKVKVYDMAEFLTYSQLKQHLTSQLQVDDCVRLMNYFVLPKYQSEAILNSDTSTENLLLVLEERDVIRPSDVNRLKKAFNDLNMTSSCCMLVDFYKRTWRSGFVNEDNSDLTASFKVMESKLGIKSDGQTTWTCHKTSEGCVYYYNSVTRQSTWEKSSDYKSNAESKRWAGMISRINSDVDSLKSVGSIKYSKNEKIGAGGPGSNVYGGKFGNKTVAVKKVVIELAHMESKLYRLMTAKAMSNVLKILYVEEDENFLYFVTELCEYDLKAVIEDNKNPIGASLSPQTRVQLCVDILSGLRDLHSIDIIHRDLKPSNILVGIDGKAYVSDFGISRNLIGETTHVTGAYGTLCWIPQEGMKIKDSKVRYKKASDVQVAGYLMYYVLSHGHHPFEATFPFINNAAKLISNVEEGNYSLFHVEIYPAQCTALLKRMLDKHIPNRPLIDDCLKEMEAVRYASRTMKSILTSSELASAPTVSVSNTSYLSESAIPDEFSRLKVEISQNLTRKNCAFLATYFNFTPAKIEVIKVESQTPGLDLFETMEEHNDINMYDLTKLQKALVALKLNKINETLVIPYQNKIDPRTHEQHKILPQSP